MSGIFGGVVRFVRLAQSTGAALVGFIQSGVGAVLRTLQDKNREVVSLEDFGAVGDGVTSDAAAAAAACTYCYETGAKLRLNGKHYNGARIEVHGNMSVEGNGSRVEYLGIGQTIIAGTGVGTAAVPTPWPTDPGYLPSIPAVTMYGIAAAVSIGDQSVTLSSVAGIEPGMLLFIADYPTSASSANNYIPRDFEFIKVKSILGNVVTPVGRLKNAYTTAGAVFYTPGLAINSRVTDLKVDTSVDAYQFVTRSAYSVKVDNVEFMGASAPGASTFTDLYVMSNIKISGNSRAISTARGTVSAKIDGVEWSLRTGTPDEDAAVFIEESFYRVSLNNIRSYGGSLSIRSLDMTGAVLKRLLTVDGSVFDMTSASNGAGSPLQHGVCSGCDQIYSNSEFLGAVVTPNASNYPGITGDALAWIASNQTNDIVKFNSCLLEGTGPGDAFKTGSGFLGQLLFDDMCTFRGVTLGSTYHRGGVWSAFPVAAPASNLDANTAYSKRDTTVRLRGAVDLNSLATGTVFGNLPAGVRPLIDIAIPVVCLGTGGAYWTVGEIVITTGGLCVFHGSEQVAIRLYLDSVTFPVI